MRRRIARSHGAGLIEVLVGAAVLATLLTGVVLAFHFYLQAGLASTAQLQAAFLAEEGLEAARSIRDRGWDEFADLSGGTHHLTLGSQWDATSTPQLIDDTFTRTVSVSDVYRRDADQDIVPEDSPDAKTLDPDTKQVAVIVTWGDVSEMHVVFENGETNGNLADFPSDNAGDGDPVQSFTAPGEAASVNRIDLSLAHASGTEPSDIYLEIRSGSAVGDVIGTSATVDADTLDDDLAWITFLFPSAVELDVGAEYFLRLRSIPDSTEGLSGSSGTIHWGYGQSASSPYDGGAARRYVGRQGNETDQGQQLDQYDFSFRVRFNGTGGEVEAVTYLTNLFEAE